jgi:hypothetical protein
VAMVVATNVLWSLLLVGLPHPMLPLYAIASGHYVQQLYFVWRFESRRAGFASLPERVRAWVAPPSRFGYLAGLTAAGGAVLFALTLVTVAVRAATAGVRPADALVVPPWLAAMTGINLSHYWLEHRIWRAK